MFWFERSHFADCFFRYVHNNLLLITTSVIHGFSLVISTLTTSSYPLHSRCSSILKEQLQFSGLNLQRENCPLWWVCWSTTWVILLKPALKNGVSSLSLLSPFQQNWQTQMLRKKTQFLFPFLSILCPEERNAINYMTVPQCMQCIWPIYKTTVDLIMNLCPLENSVWYSFIDGSTEHSYKFSFSFHI